VPVELTGEMREAINNAFTDGFPIVWSSVGEDRQPYLAFFGTTQAYSDHQLAIWMRTPERGFLRRIAENPKVAMLYRNTKTRFGMQIHGEARRVDDPEVKDRVWSQSAEFERNQDPEKKGTAVLVEVTRVIQRGQVIMERD
jgi:general stress protein 26